MLYLLPPMPALPASLSWDTREELRLPGQLGVLQFQPGSKDGVVTYPQLEVRFRTGGEAVKSRARPGKSVKKLLQENKVPPWLRDCVPLICQQGGVLAVGAPGFDPWTSLHQPSVTLFRLSGGSWIEETELPNASFYSNSGFGQGLLGARRRRVRRGCR